MNVTERALAAVAIGMLVVLGVTLLDKRLTPPLVTGPMDCIHGGRLMPDPNSPIPKLGDTIVLHCARNAETGYWEVQVGVTK